MVYVQNGFLTEHSNFTAPRIKGKLKEEYGGESYIENR